jgi:hypothetical protein
MYAEIGQRLIRRDYMLDARNSLRQSEQLGLAFQVDFTAATCNHRNIADKLDHVSKPRFALHENRAAV